MNYWLDLFTGDTWDQFIKAGANVSGFRERKRGVCRNLKQGDIFLCYLTGVKRWVGALRVEGPSDNITDIWAGLNFPVRFQVTPIVLLKPEYGIPFEQLEGKVEFFATAKMRGKFKGFLRGSPNRFRKEEDAKLILSMLEDASRNPVSRPVDEKALKRKPFFAVRTKVGKKTVQTTLAIPETSEDQLDSEDKSVSDKHTEIQYALLTLGSDMGLNVWVARNDRSKVHNGKALGDLPGIVSQLPTQFNEATQRTIELIDVLWLKENAIAAAFEVECTTSIYSGLLRMSDLLALQPNLDIRIFIVAPEERASKVEQEMRRPTFQLREKPLASVCGFLPVDRLEGTVEGVRKLGVVQSLRPDFLEKTAIYFKDEFSGSEDGA